MGPGCSEPSTRIASALPGPLLVRVSICRLPAPRAVADGGGRRTDRAKIDEPRDCFNLRSASGRFVAAAPTEMLRIYAVAVSRHDATLFTCGNSYTTSMDATRPSAAAPRRTATTPRRRRSHLGCRAARHRRDAQPGGSAKTLCAGSKTRLIQNLSNGVLKALISPDDCFPATRQEVVRAVPRRHVLSAELVALRTGVVTPQSLRKRYVQVIQEARPAVIIH